MKAAFPDPPFGGRALATVVMAAFAAVLIARGVSTRAAAGEHAVFATDSVTPAQLALGDSIFHGKAARGLCYTCHGQGAKGVAGLGPNLADAAWLHGDGGLAFLSTVIRTGVTKPKKSGAMMPPFGGSPLTAEQLTAVAAYVHSLSAKP